MLRKINAADGFPGVADSLFGIPCHIFDAWPEASLAGTEDLTGGAVIARRETALLRRTCDGAVWIGHAKREGDFKLPATLAFAEQAADLPEVPLAGWLHLGPLNIKPAELAKYAVAIYIAAYLTKKQDQITNFSRGLLPPLIVLGLLSGLVLLEPDLGTVVVMGLVVVAMLFLAGARIKHLGLLALCALPTVAALILGSPYRRRRVIEYLYGAKDPTGSGYQIHQSFLAFGSGGPFGVGLGEGKQKLFFLPEAHTDFVLALVGEELGLMGTVTIVLLFGLFVIKGFQIARRARNPFGRHLAMGITLLVGMQALVNAGVVTGLLPTKGLTLPFVSYGGSSLMANLFGVGILLNISRDRQGGQDSSGPRAVRKRGVVTE